MIKEKQTDTLPDGTVIDLDSYEWGDAKLTKREKLFIVWYTVPNQPGYQNATTAAMKAGYKKKSAYGAKYVILQKPKVKDLISQIEKEARQIAVIEAARRYQLEAIERAEYDLNDFVESVEYCDKDGNKRTSTRFKKISEIPEEKRRIIAGGLKFNNSGEPIIELPDKEMARKVVMQIAKDMQQTTDTSEEFDVETTISLIKENIATVTTNVKTRNQTIRDNSGEYIENTGNLPDFD